MQAMAAIDHRLHAGARLDPVSLRLALPQERVEGLRACSVYRRRHRCGLQLRARHDSTSSRVMSLRSSIRLRGRVEQGVAVVRVAKLEALRAGAPLEVVSPQRFLLGLIRAGPALVPRRLAGRHGQPFHGGAGPHLRYAALTELRRRQPSPLHVTLVLRRLGRDAVVVLVRHDDLRRRLARSAFFARLRSRLSLTASSRALFACVCCFFAAIHRSFQ